MINAFEFGGAGSAILAPVFKIGKELDTQVEFVYFNSEALVTNFYPDIVMYSYVDYI